MMGRDYVESLFASASKGADIAVIEGVMGLFDDAVPGSLEGSTAEIGLQSTLIRIWAKRGIPLSQRAQQGYQNFYLYSRVSPVSGESFTLFLPEVNTDMMNIFSEELVKAYPDRKIIIVMDQAGWHKAKDLTHPDAIIPCICHHTSPELNPVEKIWQWLRKEVTHNSLFETLEDMMDALEEKFRQFTPERLAQLCHCSYL